MLAEFKKCKGVLIAFLHFTFLKQFKPVKDAPPTLNSTKQWHNIPFNKQGFNFFFFFFWGKKYSPVCKPVKTKKIVRTAFLEIFLTYPFVRAFVRWFVCALVCLCIRTYAFQKFPFWVRLLVCSFVWSFVWSFVCLHFKKIPHKKSTFLDTSVRGKK